MSHPQHHHQQQTQFVPYPGPSQPQHHHQYNQNLTVNPHDTTHQPNLPPPTQTQTSPLTTAANPLVATGDWTKDLVHLAKTAELKKHALTLQLHTAHILSAHAALEQKNKSIQDIKEQKNKLESERLRLLNCLREVNEDRDKADLAEATINNECESLRQKIQQLTESDYAIAKADVDRLRQELGQPPVPTLQATLDERSAQYLNERRISAQSTTVADPTVSASGASSSLNKRTIGEIQFEPSHPTPGKRPRGRPKGSKNRTKIAS